MGGGVVQKLLHERFVSRPLSWDDVENQKPRKSEKAEEKRLEKRSKSWFLAFALFFPCFAGVSPILHSLGCSMAKALAKLP